MIAEENRLDAIARHSRYAEGHASAVVAYSFEIFQRHHRRGSILEVGPAEGLMTAELVALDPELTIVEGSSLFCADLQRRFPRARVHCALAEEFTSDRRFAAIVLGHVLEHVADPVEVLRRLSALLAPGGMIYAAVPNSRSLHRQAGVLLGCLQFEEDMSELDVHHGHRRVYNPETLRRDVRRAGLRLRHFGGFGIKVLANRQTAGLLGGEQLRAFFQLGERYPDIASDLYVLAEA